MEEKIRIIIADDNKGFCDLLSSFLKKYEEKIEILGIAYTDEEEINLIEELKPEIVITDLVRNHRYTGLDIIKDYTRRKEHPEFLVISADRKDDVIDNGLRIGGYIKKPFTDYEIVIDELIKIKKEIIREQQQIIKTQEKMIMKFGFLNNLYNRIFKEKSRVNK